MSDLTVDRILNLIDGVLDDGPCWRCQLRQGSGGTGLCGDCRAWLLDPASYAEPAVSPSLEAAMLLEAVNRAGERFPAVLAAFQQFAAALVEAYRPLIEACRRLHDELVAAGALQPLPRSQTPNRVRLCPTHGDAMTGGLCRRCARMRR